MMCMGGDVCGGGIWWWCIVVVVWWYGGMGGDVYGVRGGSGV